MIKTNKMSPQGWLVIVGLQFFTTASGYIALESGEVEEHKVEKVVEKKLVQQHEEAGELFVGVTVLSLVLGIAAFFIRKEFQFHLEMGVFLITLVACYLGFRTGQLGGDLVYKHGAAQAHVAPVVAPTETEAPPQGILPTPGENTSESTFPEDEDENEYPPEEDEVKEED
jgi:hypothetical protein